MELPKPGRSIAQSEIAFFRVHEWSGMTVLTFLVLHWIVVFAGLTEGGLAHLFPWFSKKSIKNLVSDSKSLPRSIRERFSRDETRGRAIAGAVHGLGLLVATGMAISGSIVFFGMRSNGSMNGFVHFVKEFHQFIANFLWAFLAGHVGMAIIHQWQGDKVLSRMFNLARGETSRSGFPPHPGA